MRVFPLLLVLLLPFASAQTVVDLQSWTDPAEMTIPISMHPDEVPDATLHVKGSLQCQPLTDAPVDVYLNFRGSTINATYNPGKPNEETVTILEAKLGDVQIPWRAVGNDRYVIDETFAVPLLREAVPPQNMSASFSWDGSQAEAQGTTRCDPQGYGWNVDDKALNVTVEGFDSIPQDDFKLPEEQETPAPIGLVLLALVAMAFKRKE